YPAVAGDGRLGCFCRSRSQFDISAFADRLRHAGLSLPVSHLGATSLRFSPSPSLNASCRGTQKVWTVRTVADRVPANARSSSTLDLADSSAAGWEHHFCRPSNYCAEATRSHPGLLQRYAHGLHLSWGGERKSDWS